MSPKKKKKNEFTEILRVNSGGPAWEVSNSEAGDFSDESSEWWARRSRYASWLM
jgi:hypothetical protein